MSVLIINAGSPLGDLVPEVNCGLYLKTYDPDGMDGLGVATWTTNRQEAKVFADLGAAFEEWRRVSTVRPLRSDGKPNRPLTACNITFETIP